MSKMSELDLDRQQVERIVGSERASPSRLTIVGKDNCGKPRQEFADKVAALDDDEFVNFAERKIWLSAFANNNPRSDYHWQADACYDEARRRGKSELYKQAYEQAVRSAQ
jgi:hypothetical protein